MKIGQEITQEQSAELKAALIAAVPEGSEAHQLITGISSSIWDTLLQALLTQLTTKLQDPAFLQSIITTLLGIFTKKA
jgi:hypothetical protein